MKSPAATPSKMANRGQFIHVEPYSRVVPAGKEGGRTVDDIADEAERVPKACPHVLRPTPPTLHFGVCMKKASVLSATWSHTQYVPYLHRPTGSTKLRRLRQDQPCALVGVVSVPPDFPGTRWPAFIQKSIAWLKSKYGNRLKSVVEHTDEPNRHLHFWVVPEHGEKFSAVHQGLKAKEDSPANARRAYLIKAFSTAMSKYQDEFFEAVAGGFDLLRLSIGGKRLNAEQFDVMKATLAANAKLSDERLALAARREDDLTEHLANLQRRQAKLEQELAQLKAKSRADAMYAIVQKTQFGSGETGCSNNTAKQAPLVPRTVEVTLTAIPVPVAAREQALVRAPVRAGNAAPTLTEAPGLRTARPPTPFDDMRRPMSPKPR